MMYNLLTFLRFATINSCDFLKFGYLQHIIRASLNSTDKRNTLATSRFSSQENFCQQVSLPNTVYSQIVLSKELPQSTNYENSFRSSHLEEFCKKDVLRNFTKFTGKHQSRVSFILKERPWHKCFPVNFAKFLRSPFPFLIDHLWWLPQLLIISKYSQRTIPNKYLLIESEICSKLPIRKPEGCH